MELEIKDKNGAVIKEGDLLLSTAGWCSSDGKLRKNFPERIRVIVQLCWNRHKAHYHNKMVCVHPDDMQYAEWNPYRSMGYTELNVSWDNEKRTYREDMRDMSIEIVSDPKLIEFTTSQKFDRSYGTPLEKKTEPVSTTLNTQAPKKEKPEPKAREIAYDRFHLLHLLASYTVFGKWSPAVCKNTLNGEDNGYQIRILKSSSRSALNERVFSEWDYFQLDKTGLFIESPHGMSKDFNKVLRITNMDEFVKEYAEKRINE